MADSGRSGNEVLAAALAGGTSVRRAAEQTKLSERTVYRRLTEPAFLALVQRFRQEMLHQASGRLARMTGKAIRKLNQLLDSTDEKIVLGACKLAVESSLKLGERVGLESRLAAIEQRQAEQDKAGRK